MGITQEDLNSALCYYEITIGGTGRKGGETHRRVLSMEQCLKGVEALIKATFGALFNYLVKRINQSVAGDNGGCGGGGKVARTRRGMEKEASIGILVSHTDALDLLSFSIIPEYTNNVQYLLDLTQSHQTRTFLGLNRFKLTPSSNCVSTTVMRHCNNNSIDLCYGMNRSCMTEKVFHGVL